MPNQAFQNSLRSKFSASLHSKDRDKFVASLREGGTVEDKSYLQETLSNVVPSGKKLLKETADMIMNPIDTAKSLYQLGSGVVQLAIPGEQGNEDIARAAGQYFADRYGSLEKAKESFKNDPVGVATEALGVAAGGAGLGKLAVKGAVKGAGKAKRAIDREIELNAIKDNLKHGDMGGNILTESTRLDISSFNPKTPHFKRDANKPVDEFLENIPLSLTTDTKYAKSYTYGNGFLYEINVTKPVLRKLFDYKNPDHIKKFKKQYIKDIKDPNNPVSKNYILAEKDAKGFVQKDPNVMYDIKRTAKDYENIADDLVETLKNSNENYLVMENPFVTHTLKKLKYKGTWQTEARDLADTGTSKFTTYRQIQLFNGKDANIKKVYNINSNEMTPRLYKGGIPTAATGVTKQSPEEIVVKGTKEDPFSYGNSLFSPSGIFGRGSGAIHPESPDSTFSPDTRGSAMMEDDEGYDEAYNYSQEAKENEEFNKKYDEYVISKNQSLEGKYSVANYVNTDIINKTVKETDVSKTDAYSILFGESSGGQFSHSSGIAKGGLQLTLNGFIGGKQHTKEYSYTPDRNTEKAKYDAFIENAKDDFSQLSDDDALYYSIQYMDKIKKGFPNKYGRDATLKDIAIIYTKGPGGATKFINDYSLLNKAENSLLNTYVNNVLETAESIEGVPELQEGGTPWGGSTGTIYEEPSGPKPLQQQTIANFGMDYKI
tara:strand:- start:41 stop:2185 length:2145 start_codon:yes stop_codon:yes gene_type:complete